MICTLPLITRLSICEGWASRPTNIEEMMESKHENKSHLRIKDNGRWCFCQHTSKKSLNATMTKGPRTKRSQLPSLNVDQLLFLFFGADDVVVVILLPLLFAVVCYCCYLFLWLLFMVVFICLFCCCCFCWWCCCILCYYANNVDLVFNLIMLIVRQRRVTERRRPNVEDPM